MRTVTAAILAALAGCPAAASSGPGLALVARYGCQACHVIPGAAEPQGVTGPPLDHMADQAYIAGVLPNTRDNLATFIVAPRDVDPRSAMPDFGVTPQEAGAIADYLRGAEDGG